MSKKRKLKICHNCDDCVYIGEGAYICDKCIPFIVMEDHCPSEYFAACNYPSIFHEAQQLTEDEDTPGYDTTHSETDQSNLKEVKEMNNAAYYIEEFNKTLDARLSDGDFGLLREELGILICDGLNCQDMDTSKCSHSCEGFLLLDRLEDAYVNKDFNLAKELENEFRTWAHLKIHNKIGG